MYMPTITSNSFKYLTGKDVLVVGLDEVDTMLLRYMIHEQGAHMEIENETEAALERIRERKYDLLIINTRLERLNTLNMVQKMRAAKEIRVPVIGVSAQEMGGRALHSGFDHIVRRPIEKWKFMEALEDVMD